ncbi:SDR family oxidoreductase [Rhodoferax sp.]|uniref:SDR family NAD(P)-dependent oxidoreductase n=1 Tax=Rhodoferax sp. TaxID=50421 RepID=UPI0025F8D6AD|nr:SDR family oxidoreductase [Rhodoferax sp.]
MSSAFSLAGKAVLVTGASSGIGRATAVLCAGMGAAVWLTGRDPVRLQATLDSLPGAGHGQYVADLTDEAARNALVDSLPALDGCVFCAGAVELVPARLVSEKHLNDMMQINFNVPVLLTQRLLARKRVRDDASLVYVTAVAERIAPVATSMYSAAKAALTAYVRTLALEHAKRRIRANCVSPGYVATPMLTALASTADMQDKLDLTPLGTIEPSDVAHGIGYLLAPASRWVTRSSLLIDGGLSLPMR